MTSPTPEEIRAARAAAGLSQTAAAALIYSTLRTWQDWEAGIAKMHPGLWELFSLKISRQVQEPVKGYASGLADGYAQGYAKARADLQPPPK